MRGLSLDLIVTIEGVEPGLADDGLQPGLTEATAAAIKINTVNI